MPAPSSSNLRGKVKEEGEERQSGRQLAASVSVGWRASHMALKSCSRAGLCG